jgi:hypothetical protein
MSCPHPVIRDHFIIFPIGRTLDQDKENWGITHVLFLQDSAKLQFSFGGQF